MTVIEYDSALRPPRAIEELRELAKNLALVRALVERNLKVRYRRSALGFLWTMITPAVMLVALSAVFTRAFAKVTPAYPAYVFPGLLLWNFFAQTTTLAGEDIASGGELWRRVRFPKTALAIATLITGAINLSLALVPLIAILAAAQRPLGIALLTLPITIVLAALFILGIALMLAAAALHFPDVMPAWTMLMPAMMFTAPIVYPAAILPPQLQSFMRFNPLTLYIDAFRAPLYSNSMPSGFVMMLAVALAALTIGWLLFTRSADDIPYRT
jgi:ABC-type polysaccharide/polyol phosphate export permease